MQQIAADATDDGIDGEFIRTAVDADLVGTAKLRDLAVQDELALELGEVALVVNTLLEIAHKTRSEAGHNHAPALQLQANEKVLV